MDSSRFRKATPALRQFHLAQKSANHDSAIGNHFQQGDSDENSANTVCPDFGAAYMCAAENIGGAVGAARRRISSAQSSADTRSTNDRK